jgi:hypothetical protein
LRKNWKKNEAVYRLFIDLKRACDSVRGEMKKEMFSRFRVGKLPV